MDETQEFYQSLAHYFESCGAIIPDALLSSLEGLVTGTTACELAAFANST